VFAVWGNQGNFTPMGSELESGLESRARPNKRKAEGNRKEAGASPARSSVQKPPRDAQALLAAIVESSDDAIITKDLNGIITSWNKGAERIFGYTAEEITGKPVLVLIPPDRKSEEPAILARLRAGERVDHFETIRRCKDGKLLDISLTISPIKDAKGKVIGASKIARDITDRKRGEEALTQRTRLLETLNRTGTMLAGELDLEKLVQAATDAGREISGAEFGAFFYNVKNEKGEAYMLYTISGVPREAFSKFPMPRNTEVFDPTFKGTAVVRVGDILKDPRYGKNAPYHGMPKGHLPVRSYLAVPVTSRTGEVLGGLFYGHSKPDVFTEEGEKTLVAVAAQAAMAIDNASLYRDLQRELIAHKEAEAALRAARENLARANEDLECRVQERTASLREVIAQMEEFSYSVSHDLRAPVRAMKGYAMAMLEDFGDKLDDRGRDYVGRIVRSGTRMEGLIHDILTYSRVARAEINPQPVSIQRLLTDIVQQYPAMQPPNTEIIDRQPLHSVMAHEPSLMQAISNILNNAIKFVARDVKPVIEVSTEQRNGTVRIWMKDNGIGIKPEYQHRLFGMFERIHQEGGYEGTGIGLAIVRKAAEKMGGRVGVESDGVHGSSFWIELPAASKA
jgi:PAS domain S-box-containing protein